MMGRGGACGRPAIEAFCSCPCDGCTSCFQADQRGSQWHVVHSLGDWVPMLLGFPRALGAVTAERVETETSCGGAVSSLFAVPVEGDAVVPEQLTSLAFRQATGLFKVLSLLENPEVVAALQEESDGQPPPWSSFLRPVVPALG